jgi:hypothetical protein
MSRLWRIWILRSGTIDFEFNGTAMAASARDGSSRSRTISSRRLTLAQASRLAEITQLAFQALLADRRIPIHYGIEEFREDVRTFREPEGF